MVFFSIGMALEDGSKEKVIALEETNEEITEKIDELQTKILDLEAQVEEVNKASYNLEEEISQQDVFYHPFKPTAPFVPSGEKNKPSPSDSFYS